MINPRKSTSRHIVTKVLKIKDKLSWKQQERNTTWHGRKRSEKQQISHQKPWRPKEEARYFLNTFMNHFPMGMRFKERPEAILSLCEHQRVHFPKPTWDSPLHTDAVWHSLSVQGYQPVQHVTALNTADNCYTMLSICTSAYPNPEKVQ